MLGVGECMMVELILPSLQVNPPRILSISLPHPFHLLILVLLLPPLMHMHRWFMRLAAVAEFYKVYLKYGTPPVYPFNWPSLQIWLSQVG